MTQKIPYHEALLNFDRLRDVVLQSREAIEITSDATESISIIPTQELEALLETVYLFGNQANAARLLDALQRATAQTTAPQTVASLREEFGLIEEEKVSA
jgi:antitoxin YefM